MKPDKPQPDFPLFAHDTSAVYRQEISVERLCRVTELVWAVNSHEAPIEALRRLTLAAEARDNTMGDPCRLLEVKEELGGRSRLPVPLWK